MPIEVPKGLPFSVDTWSADSKNKRHRFLTHAHKDHSQGILKYASFPIYCTRLTKTLVLNYYPKLDEGVFVGIEVGQKLLINDPYGDFTVTAFDANHCPGAVMFLFEGSFGNILHTGDCRLTSECLQSLPEKYISKGGKHPKCQLDIVFLDCTFGSSPLKMPSKQSAIQQVINCIWKYPDAPRVYLTCDLLGQEDILADVSNTFGSKIYVDKVKNPEYYQALEVIVPDILTQDSSSRFQLFDGFPRLGERAEAKIAEDHAKFQIDPLIIRPSAQWYVCGEGCLLEAENGKKGVCNQAVKDQFGIWHVCYTMHSSREELEWALLLLAPKWVISTTPSCRAMELDYVKKHCLKAQSTLDGYLWKLLGISVEVPSAPEVSLKSSICSPLSKTAMKSDLKPLTPQVEFFNRSPVRRKPLITLFGRARIGLQDSVEKIEMELEEKSTIDGSSGRQAEVSQMSVEVGREQFVESFEEGKEVKSLEKRKRACSSCVGSSKSYSDNLRSLYRSMNVSVPQPLPSLAELMKGNKFTKKKS